MDRNEFNVVVIDDELKDRSIVGDEYGFFNLNQIPLTGLILILLTGQIFNIILNKILDSILKTIIYLREVNPSRQGSRQDFNRYHLIIKIIIKIIIFVIDIIQKKIMLYQAWSSYWILVLNFSSQIYK